MSDTVIGQRPPNTDDCWDAQCARCGSSLSWRDCEYCGGEGETAPGELYEQDPLWYDEDDSEPCHVCRGEAAWPACLSALGEESPSWCDSHPMPGREGVASSTPEWFRLRARGPSGTPGGGT